MFGNFWLDDYLKKHPEAGDPRTTSPMQPFGTPSSNWPWFDPNDPAAADQPPPDEQDNTYRSPAEGGNGYQWPDQGLENGDQPPPPDIPPPPPPGYNSPWSNRPQMSDAGGLLGSLAGLNGGGGRGLLAGGAGDDTLGVPQPDPGMLAGFGLQPPGDTGQGADRLPGGAGRSMPTDDGSGPGFFSKIFGGGGSGGGGNRNNFGLGLSNIGAILMASAGGDTAKGAEAAQQGGALWAKLKEQQSEDDYRKQALAMRQRELDKVDPTEAEKQLNAMGLHRGDPGFNEGMSRLVFKSDDTSSEKEYQRAQNDPAFAKYLIDRDRARQPNVNVNAEGGKFGKAPEQTSYVYETNPDTGEQTVKMEDVTMPDGSTVQRPMTVPMAGSPLEAKAKAESGLKTLLGDMVKDYKSLDDSGGITNVNKTPFANIGTAISTTEGGQAFGQAVGSKSQAIRGRIKQKMPGVINYIRQSTGMSGKSMDSNTELNFYMQQATDPNKDYHTNLAAMDLMARQHGYNTLLEDNGIPQQDIDLARNSAEMLKKQAPPPGFKMPEKFRQMDKGNTSAVWDSLGPRAQQAFIDKYYPD